MFVSSLALALAFNVDAMAHVPCSVSTLSSNPEGYFWPLPNIRAFVADAEVIVRAKAVGVVPGQNFALLVWTSDASIQFEVQEVLKGDRSVTRLSIPGDTTAVDDLNTGAVPYRIVRRGGQSGNCIATKYKVGAEYLLLLRARDGVLNPYWAPLAPLNEQIGGREDPWVKWVREQIG